MAYQRDTSHQDALRAKIESYQDLPTNPASLVGQPITLMGVPHPAQHHRNFLLMGTVHLIPIPEEQQPTINSIQYQHIAFPHHQDWSPDKTNINSKKFNLADNPTVIQSPNPIRLKQKIPSSAIKVNHWYLPAIWADIPVLLHLGPNPNQISKWKRKA